MEKIRHHQQAIRRRQQIRAGALQRQQLVEGVDLHELQAGLGENFRPRHPRERVFHHPVDAGIAVMIRLAEHFPGFCQQYKIHAPRVHADRDDLVAEFFGGEGQAVLDFRPETQDVPAQRAGDVDRPVGKTMQFFHANWRPFHAPAMTRPLSAPRSTPR